MKKSFVYRELDLEGLQTLEAMAAAPRLNEWMYATISKRLQGKTIEIGSGIGNISACFLGDGKPLFLTDLRKNYIQFLKHDFQNNSKVLGIQQLDLVHPRFDVEYASLLEQFDGLFALNVVEHIKDDQLAIANCKKLLKKGGRLVILVPAYQFLYNGFDTKLEHYRRYNKTSLSELFTVNNLQVTHRRYFNFVGIFGWYFSGTILKKEIIPVGQMRVYNMLVPLFKLIDKLVFHRMGLSVIVEGIKE